MPHYMLRWQFSSDSAKAMIGNPHDRLGPASRLIEGFGGRFQSYYFAFGDYDGIGICEFPDNIAVAACSMQAASTGAFTRFETTLLLTSKDAEAAMRKAHDTRTGYVAPNA
jgi:uncharacterized protein with GYD domain